VLIVLWLLLAWPLISTAQTTAPTAAPRFELYGFVEGDAIIDFEQNDPNWYDANRPSRLPAFANEFGENGHFYLSPRQSRFGVNSTFPTGVGDVQATFEFALKPKFSATPIMASTRAKWRKRWANLHWT
jgi:hypothetical protein